jgi:hypothetical protein
VEFRVRFDGAEIAGGRDPVLRFPAVTELVPRERPGRTVIELQTPVGTGSVVFRTTDEILESCSAPYMEKHLVADAADFPVVKWLLDHSRIVADYGSFESREREIGDQGLAMGMLGRLPFQRLILDFLGEERCFFLMYDEPKRFGSLMDQLVAIDEEVLRVGLESPAFMLEYGDNIDGEITNPTLFKEHCLPRFQAASEKVHAAGKVLGSHMDGDLSHLVHLVPETGLDVVESFSPFPLSSLRFRDAWSAWKNRVIPWGILPSPMFEENTPQGKFEETVAEIVKAIAGEGRAILGIADQAIRPTLPERVLRAGELIGGLGRYSEGR